MPTVVSESDLFPQTFQRPNNGELADSASLLLPLQQVANRQRWNYNRSRDLVFDVTRAPFNADYTGATDAQPAIQAALGVAVVRGGRVVAPGGTYRLDTGLTIYPNLVLEGDPDQTFFNINHATADLLTMSAATSGVCGLVKDIHFGALVANTGNVFRNLSGYDAKMCVSNCAMNSLSSNLLGRWLFSESAACQWLFDECDVKLVGNVDGYRQDGANAKLTVRGGRVLLPSTFTQRAVYGANGQLTVDGVHFDANAIGSTASLILIPGSAYMHRVTRCLFDVSTSTVSAISWVAGAKLIAKGNYYPGTPFNPGGILALGSDVETSWSKSSSTSSTAITPDINYRSHSISSSGAAPTITMPTPLFPGQEFDLTIYVNGGGTWTGIGFASPTAGGLIGTVTANGAARTWRFRAVSPKADGVYSWVNISGFSDAFVVP